MEVELGGEAEALRQVGARRGAPDRNQSLGARERERPQDDRVDDTEHPGHRADREPERQNARDEKSGCATKPTPCMAKVAPGILDGHEAPSVIEAILGHTDVAEV